MGQTGNKERRLGENELTVQRGGEWVNENEEAELSARVGGQIT
jgi:hypothetical protein